MKKVYILLWLLLVSLFPTFANAAGCDSTFYGTLRQWKQYTFYDDFNANSSDKWLWNRAWEYTEEYDYNNSSSFPSFNWTTQLKNADYKVAKNTTMTVIEADSKYPILSVPASRSYNNFVIKYTLTYSTDEAGKNKYTHTECKYYQISRCGDGVVDSSYGETCDPKDTSKSWWWNGGCDVSTCKPITVASPVCNSSYNGKRVSSLVDGDYLCSEWTVSNFAYSDSTHKWTWKCGNAAWSVSCSATKPYCGDWIKDVWEACDPKDTTNKSWWWNGWCSDTCTAITVDDPVCNSSYNGQRVTSLANSSALCTKWTVKDFTYSDSTHKWTWKCENTLWKTKECSATKPYCGDWIKDAWEACDPKDTSKSWWWNGGCSDTCTAITVDDPVCNSSYNGQRVTSLANSSALCTKWTVKDFTYSDSTHKWTWKCENTLWKTKECSATKPYCGDGVRDANESCDYKDTTNKAWWWNGWCDNSCEPIIESEWCDASFYRTLRYWKQYTFYDEFNANSSDKWLRGWTMEYDEEYDYNKSSSFPKFGWTAELVNNNYKVPKNTTMKVLEADSPYPILSVPASRSYNNLFIKYNIIYSTDSAWQNKYWHSECVYYEISRCWDGVLDTNYDEVCDFADPNHTNWWNGWCDSSCNPITVAWPVCNSDYHGQRVTDLTNGSYLCREWNVSDFRYDEATHKWTWKCGNVAWDVDCRAIKPYCGDGIKDAWETCDPADPTQEWWWNDGCSLTCEPKYLKWEPVIEKTLQDKVPVERTGQVLKWTVKVTAKWWDVTDFQIQDRLPEALDYVSYKVVSNNDNLTVTWPTWPVKSGSNNIYTWNVKWTLKENHVLTLEVETKVNKMPKSEDDYLNIACVIDDGKIDCDDDEPPVKGGKLDVEKTLISENKYVTHIWQELVWQITVTAKNWDVEMEYIKDQLPSVLDYSGYKAVTVPSWITVYDPTLSSDKKEITWKTTWTLESWKSIKLNVYTTVNKMPEKTVENVACAKPQDWEEECKPWYTYDLRIKKFVWNKQNNKRDKAMTWKVWETITYRIEFGNNGDESVRVKIKDYLPKWVRFISGTLIVWKQTSEWWVGTWTFDMLYKWTEYKIDGVTINTYEIIFLNGKEKGILTIEGEILNDTKNTTNFVCIFDENSDNKEPIACDDAHHNITDEVMCKKLDITTRSFGNGWWSTNVSCSTDGWKAKLIELDCGNGTVITWANISVLPWTCSYPSNSSSSSKSYSVQCKVDGKTTNDCKSTVSVQWKWWGGSDDPYCTRPEVSWSERVKTVVCSTDNDKRGEIKIDCGYWNQVYTSNWKVKSFTWTCDYTNAWYGTYKIRCWVDNRDIRESDCTREVSYTKPWDCDDCPDRINGILSPMKCFNINAWNISVEEWEILPFYWNIEKLDEKTVEDLRYVEWGNKNYGEQMFDKLLGQSCDRFGDIALNSMICYASVVDWYNNAIVKDKKFACLDAKWAKKDKVINAWINWQSCKYNGCQLMQSYDPVDGTDYTFRSNAQIIEKLWVGVTNLNLWEYYVSLDRVEYLYCDWEKRTEWKSVNTTCRSNFVLTSPYTVQKTPSWNLKASTQTLYRFKPQVWGKIFSEYINAISTSTYSKNTAVEDAMDKFIKKYEKLAVKVDTTKFWKDVVVKKVPWKDIYFLEWDAEFSSNGAKIDKPFTIVQTKWSTTIDGDLQYNMMLLTKNNITFKWNCTSDQAVKWIFYAWWRLYRAWANDKEEIEKNKSKDNTYWCDAWWLHIKWVLIWDNFDNLMKSSRSHIDGWWKSDGESRYWENDLRTKVMNWASVLIEYSPSVFTKSTMPPGAEDFTTALSIYKQ